MKISGMIHHLADFIEENKIQLSSWTRWTGRAGPQRLGQRVPRCRQERYFRYITEEVIPLIKSRNQSAGCDRLLHGRGSRGDHFLRRPDLFRGVIALSGVYDADYFFDGWMNSTLYDNSPERFLPNIPAEHPWIQDVQRSEDHPVLCGQGAWEEMACAR